MKVIIVEDELPSVRRLARLLQGFEIEILAQLNSIKATLNWFQKNKQPDVIFLDIQLSDGDCFEIFKHIEITSKIIFTTAFSNYSIKAFDYNSISYLLKPINKYKLSEAIHKAKNAHQKEEDLERFKKLILNHQTEIYKESFTIKVGNKIKIIKADEVVCFYSFDNATYIKTDTNNYIISDSLTSLEADLNPKDFFRVNRTFIINKTTLKEMINYSNSRLKLILNVDIKAEIIVSRERVKEFKNWID
tara:strand:+ start:4935 stop:5675 length:741 start_codon:yes stop_codon:yes gene_type:complete